MRTQSFAIALLALALSAPPALACQLLEPPPALPKVFWPASASETQANTEEVALEVRFVRYAKSTDPKGRDVVIVDCGPMYRVYSVIRVLAGDASEHQEILLRTAYDFQSDERVLIGRLVTQREVGLVENRSLDVTASVLVLKPRLPLQQHP